MVGPETIGPGAGGAGLAGFEVVAASQRKEGERDSNPSTKYPAE